MTILYKTQYSRAEAEDSPTDMYIFTDTLQRSSGTGGMIGPESWYFKEYQPRTGRLALWYPASTTTSVVRGLPGAYPVCTAKLMWTKTDHWEGGLWEDADLPEFINTVGPEIDRISRNLGNYRRLILPFPGILGRKGSMINQERCPLIWSWLSIKLDNLLKKAENL